MSYLLVKRRYDSEDFIKLMNEVSTMGGTASSLFHQKSVHSWTKEDAIAFTSTEYFREIVDCVELNDKDITFLSLKYSDFIYKVIAKELDEDLFEKMKSLGNMSRKLRELDNAISSLQSAEYDIDNLYEEVTGDSLYICVFEDLNIDEHSEKYSMNNDDVREVFKEFFN
jgi:hypothetical protein